MRRITKNGILRKTKMIRLVRPAEAKMDDYREWCRTIDANTKEETVNPDWVITDTNSFNRNYQTRPVMLFLYSFALLSYTLSYTLGCRWFFLKQLIIISCDMPNNITFCM